MSSSSGHSDHWVPAALDVLLGSTCAGCGVPGRVLCPSCLARLRPTPRLVDTSTDVLVVAGISYADIVGPALVAWKERGERRLDRVFGAVLAAAIADVVRGGPSSFDLVPVPTAASHVRRRGRDHAGDLAVHAARRLRRAGLDARARPRLALGRPVRDQAGLTAAQRQLNLAGAAQVTWRGRRAAHRPLVLVDDVVTTGASLAESHRAASSAGLLVVGAATVAARYLS